MDVEPSVRTSVRTASRLCVEAESMLPTRRGTFRMIVFRYGSTAREEHVAIVAGDLRDCDDEVLVRVHSECLTGEVFGSLKCDCAEQLDQSMKRIGHSARGVVLYLRQEGRGIGLANKVRAYALQAKGLDTVDANRALGLPDDSRRYECAVAMLDYLGVRSVRLMTNNPDKVQALRSLGVDVRSRESVLVAANPHSAGYLSTKRTRMGHVLPRRDDE